MLLNYNKKYRNICLKLFLNVFRSEPWNYSHLEDEKMALYFEDMENTPNFKGFIYMEQETIQAFCFGIMSSYFGATTFDIKEIVVDVNAQGKGIGSKMLCDIERDLRKIDVSAITLMTRKEIAAFKFYDKNGYDVSEGAVVMSKFIK